MDEFPQAGETILAAGLVDGLGGKGANQAVAAAHLGAKVGFAGAVGSDSLGASLLSRLAELGVDTGAVRRVDASRTGLALVTVAAHGENTIVVFTGANSEVNEDDILRAAGSHDAEPALILAQGETSVLAVDAAARFAESSSGRFVLNLAPVIDVDIETLTLADPLIVNRTELELVATRLGADASGGADLDALVQHVAATPRSLIVTLGADGARVVVGDVDTRIPAPAVVHVVDTTGAGDAFTGAVAAALAQGADVLEAAQWGVLYGSLAVEKRGATESYVSASRFREALAAQKAGQHV